MTLYLVSYCCYNKETLGGSISSVPVNFRNDPPGIVELEYLKDKMKTEADDENLDIFITSLFKVTDDRIKEAEVVEGDSE